MKRKILMGMTAMIVLMALTGCRLTPPQPLNQQSNQQTVVNPSIDDELDETDLRPDVLTDDEEKMMGDVDAYHDNDPDVEKCVSNAAFDLLSNLEPNEDGNLLISPYSIDSAVGMTEFGASDKTLDEMEQIVNGNADVYEMANYLKAIGDNMANQDDVEWNIANSIWMNDRDDVSLNDRFLQDVKSFYNAEINVLPFNLEAKDQINNWVNTQTHEMIPEIIDNIPPAAICYLINAVAFEGKWENEYEDSAVLEDMDFTNADGSISKVTMLRSEEDSCFEYEGSLAFARPYAGGNYYFVGIVPGNDGTTSKDMSVEEYIQKIADSDESFSKAFLSRDYSNEVQVLIPEFEMDYEAKLAETYMDMGMTTPFDESAANFQQMFDADGVHQFWIDDIIHKTHIEVDREGTKAAAATAVVMFEAAAMPMQEEPKKVYLDQPFVYAIVDGETGMPLFAGYINNL